MQLSDESFMFYAAKYYDMRQVVSFEEFHNDIKRFQYLKKLFRRYKEKDDLKIRLILNHIIVIYNVFGPEATNLLFLKLDEFQEYLKPFVLFLSYLPEKIEYNDMIINSSDIPMDPHIIEELRKIL